MCFGAKDRDIFWLLLVRFLKLRTNVINKIYMQGISLLMIPKLKIISPLSGYIYNKTKIDEAKATIKNFPFPANNTTHVCLVTAKFANNGVRRLGVKLIRRAETHRCRQRSDFPFIRLLWEVDACREQKYKLSKVARDGQGRR